MVSPSEARSASKKVVLVRVPENLNVGIQQMFMAYECLGLDCLAAYVRQHGHHVVIVDGTLTDTESGRSLSPAMKSRLADELVDLVARARLEPVDPADAAWKVARLLVAEAVLNESPDLVGFSLISSVVYQQVAETVSLLRELGLSVPICAGGEQASLYASDIMQRIPGLDACICGEGEVTFAQWVDSIGDRQRWGTIHGLVWRDGDRLVANPARPLVQDLDTLPEAARDTLDDVLSRGGDALMYGSRGCGYACSFCSIVEFYGAEPGERWRGRSPSAVVAEMARLHEQYGADRFWFIDDEFFGMREEGRRRGAEAFRLMEEARLPVRVDLFCRANDLQDFSGAGQFTLDLDQAVRAGLRRVFIGIESGSDEMLKTHFRKGTRVTTNEEAVRRAEAAGIDVLVEFIMFTPWTELRHVEENLAFLRSMPRGRGAEVGKYDPLTLSSRLYIHRETPLGRDFIRDHQDLVDHEGADVGLDYLVPYKIRCPRTRALAHIIDHGWERLGIAVRALEELYRVVDRFWVPAWRTGPEADRVRCAGAEHGARLAAMRREMDDQCLLFFEEALAFVRDYPLGGDSPAAIEEFFDAVYEPQRELEFEVDNVATYLYSEATPVLHEAWHDAQKLGLLGRWSRTPSVLVAQGLHGRG